MSVSLVSHSTPVEEKHGKTLLDVVAYCARVSNPGNQSNMATGEKLVRYLISVIISEIKKIYGGIKNIFFVQYMWL